MFQLANVTIANRAKLCYTACLPLESNMANFKKAQECIQKIWKNTHLESYTRKYGKG